MGRQVLSKGMTVESAGVTVKVTTYLPYTPGNGLATLLVRIPPAVSEAEIIGSKEAIQRAYRHCRDRQVQVTKSSEGVVLHCEGHQYVVPAVKVKAVVTSDDFVDESDEADD